MTEPDVNFHKIVRKRLEAVKVLQQSPNDQAALKVIEECDVKLSEWAVAGEKEKKNIDPNISATLHGPEQPPPPVSTNIKAYAALSYCVPHCPTAPIGLLAEQFAIYNQEYVQNVAMAKVDIGKKLLQKHGWKEGLGLGKELSGVSEPILPDIKIDRKGLQTDEELMKISLVAPTSGNGKHPVSMLQELCQKNKLAPPEFHLESVDGPPHRQSFLISVTVNDIHYQPTSSSATKKEAKTLAATLALQSLGFGL